MTRAKPAAASVIAMLLIAGCMARAPAPTETYYRLQPAQIAAPNVSRLPMSVRVERFTADGVLRERALVYSEDDGHRVLKQHHYHFWMDSPTRMLHDYWATRLQRAERVRGVDSRTPEYTLHGRVRRMERLLRRDGVDVALGVDLRLRHAGTGADVVQRRYDVVERAASASVVDSVKAYERALRLIHARFVGDLAATPALAGAFARGLEP